MYLEFVHVLKALAVSVKNMPIKLTFYLYLYILVSTRVDKSYVYHMLGLIYDTYEYGHLHWCHTLGTTYDTCYTYDKTKE